MEGLLDDFVPFFRHPRTAGAELVVFQRLRVRDGSLTLSFEAEFGMKAGSSSQRTDLSLPLTILYAKSDIAELEGIGRLPVR